MASFIFSACILWWLQAAWVISIFAYSIARLFGIFACCNDYLGYYALRGFLDYVGCCCVGFFFLDCLPEFTAACIFRLGTCLNMNLASSILSCISLLSSNVLLSCMDRLRRNIFTFFVETSWLLVLDLPLCHLHPLQINMYSFSFV